MFTLKKINYTKQAVALKLPKAERAPAGVSILKMTYWKIIKKYLPTDTFGCGVCQVQNCSNDTRLDENPK